MFQLKFLIHDEINQHNADSFLTRSIFQEEIVVFKFVSYIYKKTIIGRNLRNNKKSKPKRK